MNNNVGDRKRHRMSDVFIHLIDTVALVAIIWILFYDHKDGK